MVAVLSTVCCHVVRPALLRPEDPRPQRRLVAQREPILGQGRRVDPVRAPPHKGASLQRRGVRAVTSPSYAMGNCTVPMSRVGCLCALWCGHANLVLQSTWPRNVNGGHFDMIMALWA